jgi:uncharacterized transporter YbjL
MLHVKADKEMETFTLTDPQALAFAHGMYGSEAPSVAYASVYPLTMVLRVAAAPASQLNKIHFLKV